MIRDPVRTIQNPKSGHPRQRVIENRFAALGAAFFLALGSGLVSADRTVAARPRQFRACVLLVPTPGDPLALNPTALPQTWPANPWVFYVLQNRTDVKPDGWEYFNPAAPGQVGETHQLRWMNVMGIGNPMDPAALKIGERLTKSKAPYWEVLLSADNYDRLAEMDIIYLPIWQVTHFSEEQRKLLTRLVDGGALLWLDWGRDGAATSADVLGGGGGRPNPFFLPLDFANGAAPGAFAAARHPLLQGVFRIGNAEAATLGLDPAPGAVDSRGNRSLDLNPPFAYQGPRLSLIIPGGGGAYLAAARYNSGFIVASAGNIGRAISRPIPPIAQAPALADLMPAELPDMKFAYNVCWWRGEYSHSQKGPRHVAVGTDPLQGLIERWQDDGREPLLPAQPPVGLLPPLPAPLIVDNFVIGTQVFPGANPDFRISTYEVEPTNDLDGDGQADDMASIPLGADFAAGKAYDRFTRWSSTAAGMQRLSGLAYGEINDRGLLFAGGTAGGNGVAAVLGVPDLTAIGAVDVPLPGRPSWSAPAYSAAPVPSLYVSGGSPGGGGGGMVVGYRLATGPAPLVAEWHFPPGNAQTVIGPVVSSPVPAQIQDKRTGAIDRIVLFTHLHNIQGPGGFGGIVRSTISEPLTLAQPAGAPHQIGGAPALELVPIRRTERWDKNPGVPWEVRIVDRTGYTVVRLRDTTNFTDVDFNVKGQPGRTAIRASLLPPAFATQGLAGFSIVADYFVLSPPDNTPGMPGPFAPPFRYRVPAFFTPGTTQQGQTGIAGGVAVGRDELCYYGTGRGYMAAVGFESATPRVRWKAIIAHKDLARWQGADNTNLDLYTSGPNWLNDHAFVNTPAFGNNVIAFASREGVIYVFEADATVTAKLPGAPFTAQEVAQIELIAPDENNQPQRVPRDQYSIDPDSGIVTFRDMRGFTLDLSQAARPATLGGKLGVPITARIRAVDQTVPVAVPLVYLADFSNTGEQFLSSPVISGDRLYVIGSRAPGFIYELPLDPRKEDPAFGTLSVPAPSPADLDLARFRGGSLVRQRDVGATVSPPAISHGIMALNTNRGTTAYHSPGVLIADSNRVVEVTGDSHLRANTDSVTKQNLQGSEFPIPTDPQFTSAGGLPIITTRKFLDHPATVRILTRESSLTSVFNSSAPTQLPDPTNPPGTTEHSEFAERSSLVADTGNNRVVEYNPTGKAIYEITEFQDPWRLLPAGEPRQLNSPTDVQRWVDTEVDPTNPNVPLLVFHTLVTDTGNNRVLEIVDKVRWQRGNFTANSFVRGLPGQVDFSGQPIGWYHVLVWSSQTNGQGLRLKYRNAQRIFWPDASGNRIPDPGRTGIIPSGSPPYLTIDAFYSVTVCTINGQQVFFPPPQPRELVGRPSVRLGGDTIAFLVGRRAPNGMGGFVDTPFRGVDPGSPVSATDPDKFAYVQGSLDPTFPLFREIYQEGPAVAGEPSLHTLNAITSLQRTIRRDANFTPTPAGLPPVAQYFLLADAAGVFEFRFDPSAPFSLAEDHRARLAWAFLKDDYAFVTGAGNGNPLAVRNANGQYQGTFFQVFTPSSARWLSNGSVLISSRTLTTFRVSPMDPRTMTLPGCDVFMLRPGDFKTVFEPPFLGQPYDPSLLARHGWIPDGWVFGAGGPPPGVVSSIIWRTPAPVNYFLPPSSRTAGPGANPLQVVGTYAPEQPSYADLVF